MTQEDVRKARRAWFQAIDNRATHKEKADAFDEYVRVRDEWERTKPRRVKL